jgi:DNA/RNA endonuclease G, NUC1
MQTDSDKTVTYVTDNVGGKMAIPKAYYKVLLKFRITSNSYSAIGFWYENKAGYDSNPSVGQTYTVREIERRTGENFFPNLPDDVEEKVENEYLPNNWL